MQRFCFFLIPSLVWTFLVGSEEALPYKINIIGNSNGVGITKDIEILQSELERLGHQTALIQPKRRNQTLPEADINIFLEHVWEQFFPLAEKQFFLPNPEWFKRDISLLKKCDLILCRTKDCENIFSKLHLDTYHLGFTSQDRYEPFTEKHYTFPIHSIGKSIYKGTQSVLNVWEQRPDFPLLTYLEVTKRFAPSLPNVKYYSGYIEDTLYKRLQNQHGLHLCPSQSEGFGHYILEAMSTAAVVLTTNAPPMNEHIDDPRCLVEVKSVSDLFLGKKYEVDEQDLERKIEALMQLSKKELAKIGKRNRVLFLERRAYFQERMEALFGNVEKNNYDNI